MIDGRSFPRRMNTKNVSQVAQVPFFSSTGNYLLLRIILLQIKLCQLLALDFCCLNIELPEACRNLENTGVDAIGCRWTNIAGKTHITPIKATQTSVSQSRRLLATVDLDCSSDPFSGEDCNSPFLPGSLAMPRAQILKKCYADPVQYSSHFGALCSVSERSKCFVGLLARSLHKITHAISRFKIACRTIPKSASSTNRYLLCDRFLTTCSPLILENNRHILRDQLDASECDCGACVKSDYYRTAFVRNPLTRFFAQYEEMTARRLDNAQSIPEKFRAYISDLPSYKVLICHSKQHFERSQLFVCHSGLWRQVLCSRWPRKPDARVWTICWWLGFSARFR